MDEVSTCLSDDPRIALIVDNPFRDLPGLVLTAWKLCQEGATCLLVPSNLREAELWQLAPDFVLFNHVSKASTETARKAVEAGIRIGVLETEGAIFTTAAGGKEIKVTEKAEPKMSGSPYWEYSFRMTDDAELRDNVSCFCAWSTEFADYVRESGWFPYNSVVVTGPPRVDYYTSQWRAAALQMSQYADTFASPNVVVTSSFSLANPAFHTHTKEAELLVNLGYDRNYVSDLQNTERLAQVQFVEMVEDLAKRLPNLTFLLRPHPFENASYYESTVADFGNLHLVKQGSVDGWLMRAVAMVHWDSSTALEGRMSGIPSFTPNWIPQGPSSPLVDRASVKIDSIGQLVAELSAAAEGRYVWPCGQDESSLKAVEDAYYLPDGKAHERVSQTVLEAIGSVPRDHIMSRCRRFAYRVDSETGIRRVGALFRMILELSPKWSFRSFRDVYPNLIVWDESDKAYDVPMVEKILDGISSCAGDKATPVVTASAADSSEYRFGATRGRTVVMFTEP